jgi:hypothetical protein
MLLQCWTTALIVVDGDRAAGGTTPHSESQPCRDRAS